MERSAAKVRFQIYHPTDEAKPGLDYICNPAHPEVPLAVSY